MVAYKTVVSEKHRHAEHQKVLFDFYLSGSKKTWPKGEF